MRKNNDPPLYAMSRLQIKAVVLCSGIIVYWGIVFLVIKDVPPLVDERWHYPQIYRFAHGEFNLDRQPSALPGYHLFMAGVVRLFRNASLPFIRGVNIGIGGLAMIVFALLLQKIHQRLIWSRLLQFAFFPLILPYFFLIYTDILSLLFVLLGFYLGLERKYALSGIVCCISLAIRQNNIIWLLMIVLVTYCYQEGIRWTRSHLLRMLKSCWPFGIGMIGMLSYTIINGGIAFGDKAAHPLGKIYTGNVFFILFLYGLFFLPGLIFHAFRGTLLKWEKKYLMILGLGLVVIFGIYLATFQNSHPYNQHPFHLRNYVLMLFTAALPYKIVFFFPIALALCNLVATPLKNRTFFWLYPFTVCALLPSWLIEQRYYIPSFAFYLLFMQKENETVEKVTAVYDGILSSFFIYGIGKELFFL